MSISWQENNLSTWDLNDACVQFQKNVYLGIGSSNLTKNWGDFDFGNGYFWKFIKRRVGPSFAPVVVKKIAGIYI